ncbi:MAG: hypothetical protein JWM20_681 [Patescibacteria group bacterium]|nr:hypothetical protein [Patescibacteria group bacterium]
MKKILIPFVLIGLVLFTVHMAQLRVEGNTLNLETLKLQTDLKKAQLKDDWNTKHPIVISAEQKRYMDSTLTPEEKQTLDNTAKAGQLIVK